MKKRRVYKFLRITSVLLVFLSIFSMLCFAAPSHIVEDDTASYFKLSFDAKNGLPDDMVYDIATTADGYMWFATQSGLVRYDGSRFELINKYTTDGFEAVGIRRLLVDGNGNLWIGTDNSNVICKTSEGYKNYVSSVAGGSGMVNDLIQLDDGTIAVATTNGVYFVKPDGTLKELENPENIYLQAKSFALNSDNNVLICLTQTGKIVVIKDEKLISASNYRQTKNGMITCICYLKDGVFRVGTSEGVVIDADIAKQEKLAEYRTSFSSIERIYGDVNGHCMVVGSKGLGCIDSKNSYSEDAYFEKMALNAICLDFQGNYWFAVNGKGVLETGKSAFIDIAEKYSLPHEAVNCVLKYDDILYMGTNTGVLAVDEKAEKIVSNEFTSALSGKKINDLKISNENRIMAATDNDGVYAYGGSLGLKHYTQNNQLIDDHVNTICVLKDLYIALGYEDGISIDLDKKRINEFNEDTGVAGNVIAIYRSAISNDLLIGTEGNGGYRLTESGKVIPFSKSDSTGCTVKAMLDSNDRKGIWIGYGSELYYYTAPNSGKKISKLSLTHNISDMFHDNNGRLWIVTSDKIIIADEKNLIDDESGLNIDTICKKDGLANDILLSSYNYMSDDGLLYLCTGNGVIRTDTGNYKINRTSPRLAIDYVYADDKPIGIGNNKIALSSDVGRLEIGISAISFYLDSDYKLSFKLDDAENYSTIDINEGNQIVYTNLGGGEHKLEIKLIDTETNNVVSKKEITINKEYSVVEVKFFKIMLVIVALLMLAPIVYLILSYRLYRNKKKHKRSLAIAEQAMHSFAKTIDAKDPYTKGHSERVAEYTVEIARRYGISEDRIKDLYYAALLHDIGKIGIPDSILKKPSKLTQEEYELMKTHTTVGAEILKDIPIVKNIQFGARDHHERFDGTGYPRGIAGNLISFEGRIIGAADAYDAMTTLRGYNTTLSHKQIKKEIEELSGKQFDPTIAKIVMEMIDDGYFAPPEVNPEDLGKKNRKLRKHKKDYRSGKNRSRLRVDKNDGEGEEK